MKHFLGCVVAMGVALLIGAGSASADTKKLSAFKLKNAEGKEVTQDAYKEKKTVFVVVQTACSQCQTELAEVAKNLDKFKAKGADVTVLLVDQMTDMALKRYQDNGYTMPVLMDPMFLVPQSVGVDVTPGTFVVQKDLSVTYTKTGFRPGSLDSILDQL